MNVAADQARGLRPTGMKEDAAIISQFCTELHESEAASDPTFKAGADQFERIKWAKVIKAANIPIE